MMSNGGRRIRLAIFSLALVYLLSLSLVSQITYPPKENTGGEDIPAVGVNYIEGLFMDMARQVTPDLIHWLTENPVIYDTSSSPPIPDSGYQGLTKLILKIILIPYQILILLTGIYIVYASVVPRKRAFAKHYLTRLIVGMVLTGLSPIIFQVLLELEHGLLLALIQTSVGSAGGTCHGMTPEACLDHIGGVVSLMTASMFVMPYTCALGGLGLIIVIASYAVVWLRWAVVTALGILFPATIFLYMWNYTQGIGRKLMKYTFIWIFMPIVQAFFIVLLAESASNWMSVQGAIMALGSFIGVMLSPLIMTGLLKVVGSMTVMVGSKTQSPFLTGAGHLMMGHGPYSLSSAASMKLHRDSRLRQEGQSPGGVPGAEKRPSVGVGGGVMGAFRALRSGESATSALKTGFFGTAGKGGSKAPGARHQERFEKGVNQLFGGGGLRIGSRLKGLANIGLSLTAQTAHAHLLHPIGYGLTGLFHKESDIAPKWLRDPLNQIGEAFLEGKPVRGVLQGVGSGLGVWDKDKGIRPWRLAGMVGLGLGMFTPIGHFGFAAAVGGSLLGGFVFGQGLSMKGVAEGYGEARRQGRGVIRSALSSAVSGLNIKAGLLARKRARLQKRRSRMNRPIRKHMAKYDDRLAKLNSNAKIAHNGAEFVLNMPDGTTINSTTPATAPGMTPELKKLHEQMNATGTSPGSTLIAGTTLGDLVNERAHLDNQIEQVTHDFEKVNNLGRSVDALASTEGREPGIDLEKSADKLDGEAEETIASAGMSFEGLDVAEVNSRATRSGSTANAVISEHIEGLARTDPEKLSMKTNAYAAHAAGNDGALRDATGRVERPGDTAEDVYNNASTEIAGMGLSPEEERRRKTTATQAIGMRARAAARRTVAAERFAGLDTKRFSTEQLGKKQSLLHGELARRGLVDRVTGVPTAMAPRNDNERMMLSTFNRVNSDLTPVGGGLSPAQERDAKRMKPNAQARKLHADYVQDNLSTTDPTGSDKHALDNQHSHSEYLGRVEDDPHMRQIFQLDDDREADVNTLVPGTIRGDESSDELNSRRQQISQAIQDQGKAEHIRSLGPAATKSEQREEKELRGRSDAVLSPLGLHPTMNATVMSRVTQEVSRNQLLDQHVVNTHQMAYDEKGQFHHVSDKARAVFDPSGTSTGNINTTDAATQMMADGNSEFTCTARELYDYRQRGRQMRTLTAKREAFHTVEEHGGSPEIAVHMSQYDRDVYKALPTPTGDYIEDPVTHRFVRAPTPGTGTHSKERRECFVSTVDGLSDEAAGNLHKAGIKNWAELSAIYPQNRRMEARCMSRREQMKANNGGVEPTPGTPERRQYDKLGTKTANYKSIADANGEADVFRGSTGDPRFGGAFILNQDGINTTVEDVASGAQYIDTGTNTADYHLNATTKTYDYTPGAGEYERQGLAPVSPDVIDSVYEYLNPVKLHKDKLVGFIPHPWVSRAPRNPVVELASVERQLKLASERAAPIQRELIKIQDGMS
ncbi:MAG: hypothetical protein ABH851_00685 [Methanobacteriota archaeon]